MSNQTAKPEQWTDEQWQAITVRGQHLLVAAAAGSGKTSVLVERIIRQVTQPDDPVSVDRLLVVTFTNAAAAEMRHRIGEALRKAVEQHPGAADLRRQLALLQRASITTLHSFCLGLLRQYYYVVDIDPDFRIADQLEVELLRRDVLESLLEEWYEHDQEFQELAEGFVDEQGDNRLEELLLHLYDFSRSHPDPAGWLEQAAAMFDVDQSTSLDSLPWTSSLLAAVCLELQRAEAAVARALELAEETEELAAYVPLLQQERAAIAAACRREETSWEGLAAAVHAISFGRLPTIRGLDPELVPQKEQVQSLRNQAKEIVNKLREDTFTQDAALILRDLQRTAPLMQTLARLVNQFADAFEREKQARSLVDFSDLEHLALRILTETDQAGRLQPSPVARQLQEQFVEVLVDEYQDINLVQETILEMVSRPPTDGWSANRFMVGDVKQSIYRFRLAEPKLFMQKYLSYRRFDRSQQQIASLSVESDDPTQAVAAEPGVRIDLAANFRSRREVVDAVNYLFRLIMSPRVGEIAYDKAAELICRADYPLAVDGQLDVEVHLIDRSLVDGTEVVAGAAPPHESTESDQLIEGEASEESAAEEASAAQLEARLIAQQIRRWIEPGQGGEPLLVYDKQTKGMRPVSYRDIVILLRASSSWAQPMMEEFRAAGIPVYAEQSDGYFSATEVEVMLSLLRLIDNPRQDIPLAAVLRSPIVGLSENRLAEIRVRFPSLPFHEAVERFARQSTPDEVAWIGRLQHFLRRLEHWRTTARRRSLAELITDIYRDTGYVDYVSALENGKQRQANLRALHDRSKQYEAGSHRGLFRFLRFIDRLQQQGSDLGEARTIGESEDVVRVMTIHKSKGLEFPVVFVAGLGKRFNTQDLQKQFLVHKDLGFGPYVVDPSLRLRYPSFAHHGIKQQLRLEMLAEEMRVLYVALTRAREKLLLVGSAKGLGEQIGRWCEQALRGERMADEELIQARCYLDWIGRALIRHPAGLMLREMAGVAEDAVSVPLIPDDSRWRFQLYQASDLPSQTTTAQLDEQVWKRILKLEPIPVDVEIAPYKQLVEERLGWQYPHRQASQTAAKWSVSDLKHVLMRQQGDDSALWTPSARKAMRLPQITQRPRFLTSSEENGRSAGSARFTSSEIGTIMHLVMQHVDMSGSLDETDLRGQLAELVARQYLTAEEAAQVDVARIAAFFQSKLGAIVRGARSLHRELPFTMAIPVGEIDPEQAGADERVIVQGVIDCLVEGEDGRLILIDYKTDAIYGEWSEAVSRQLANRYREQVGLYARAVKHVYQRPVDECYLYFFSRDAAISVPVRD
ncbi:helicase-exonuclease AddAB subunit AddA [Brevibacillus humidisoli]|uniref:helicase-exonuclease AddAB subunit AddA n=1 Tax=Brevibacillus humidisoli TaxID=2895522 RepID=UPI001E62960B|nr:helicase-exonuclease AddAB subunit AddA [Brevibacillus humidisoli]UFJ39809.1 helicase-exonuclease AddAB subunit AddA [Brevibacillus humidisoli]